MTATTYTLPPGTAEWLRTGERGVSSEAIFERMNGIAVGGGWWPWRHPLDPADLRRCRLLLEAVPAFAARLGEMRDVSAEWAALVGRWSDLCALMDREAPRWREGEGGAPLTYELMREIEEAARG